MATTNDEHSQSSSKSANDQKLSAHHLSNHWLFNMIDLHETKNPKDSMLSNGSEQLNVVSLESAFQRHLSELKKQQKELPVIDDECAPIQADISVLATDKPKYLFKDDTLIYKRDTNPSIYSVLKEPFQPTREENFPNYFLKLGTRLQLPRRAKNKESDYTDMAIGFGNDDDDDDDDDDFQTKSKRKASKDLDIASKQPLKKVKNGDKDCIDITGEDEDKNNKEEESILMDSVSDNSKQQTKPGILDRVTGFMKKTKSIISTTTSKQNSPERKTSENNPSKHTKKDKVGCPMCNKMFSQEDINEHAFDCQGPVEPRTTRGATKTGKDASGFAPWTFACHGIESFPRNECNLAEEMGLTKKPTNKPEGYSARERNRPVNISSTSFRNKENMQDRHSPIPNLNQEDSDKEDIFQGYTSNQNRKKPMRTYSRPTHPRNSLDDSQDDDGLIKCAKCDNIICEKNLAEHTNGCLENSHISV